MHRYLTMDNFSQLINDKENILSNLLDWVLFVYFQENMTMFWVIFILKIDK